MLFWSLQKALNDIRRRKIRSILTVFGIFIGVAGIVAIVATATNLASAQRYNVSNSSQEDMRWWVWDNPPSLKPVLEQLPNVVAVERRGNYGTKFRADEQWRDIVFYAFEDYSNIQVNRIDFVEGRAPRGGEVAFEISVRSLLPNLKIGDPVLYRGNLNNLERQLIISGFIRTSAYPSASLFQQAVAYVNTSEMQRMLGTPGFNGVLVRVEDLALRDQTKRQIEDTFRKRNLQFASYVARDPDFYLGKNELNILLTLLLVFSIIGLVISGFLVANTLSAIVAEQVGEIGTLKAIGAGSRQILQVYLLAALIYGLVGTILGLLGGFLGGKLLLDFLGSLLNFEVSSFFFQPSAMWLGIAVGLGVTLLAALIPAWGGTAITVREALSSYGINNNYGQGLVDRLLARVRFLPPLVAMSLRNLSRRKMRNLVTFGVISLSCAAFLAAQSSTASIEKTTTSYYELYQTDAWVSFGVGRINNQFAPGLKGVEGVALAEPWARSRGIIQSSSTDVYGVPPDTEIYRKKLQQGRWFGPNENGVATISNVLANAKNIKLGDIIEVELNRQRQKFVVIGILDDSARYLISNALGKIFLPLEEAERVMGHQGQPDFYTITTLQKDPEYVDKTLRLIEQRFRNLQPNTVPAYSDREIIEQISQYLRLLLYAVAVIIGVIGSIGVINTVTLNVLERRREIGVLRSLGGDNRNLVQLFITEGLFLGMFGFIAGVLLGYPLSNLVVGVIAQATFPIEFVFDWQIVLFTLLFALVLTGGSSLFPALGAARIKVTNTLRYD
jgi:putative ABC transport system permease protein